MRKIVCDAGPVIIYTRLVVCICSDRPAVCSCPALCGVNPVTSIPENPRPSY